MPKANLPAALEAFDVANRIDPNDLEMVANRITILKDLGRFTQAEALLAELNPNKSPNRHSSSDCGAVDGSKQTVEATRIFQCICHERPSIASYWLNWAAALRGLRHTVSPYRILKRGLSYEPSNTDLQEALQQILAEMGRPEASARCLKLWAQPEETLKQSYLFSRQFLGIGTSSGDSQALANQARKWELQTQKKQLLSPLWCDTLLEPIENRKLRVGYLSADLANHPVGRFLLPVLTNHDRESVEIWALSCGSHDDWITDHIRQRVDHWIDILQTTPQRARIVADLRLDVL